MIKSEETCHYFKILILIFCFSLFTFSQPLYHAFPLGLLVGCQGDSGSYDCAQRNHKDKGPGGVAILKTYHHIVQGADQIIGAYTAQDYADHSGDQDIVSAFRSEEHTSEL